MNQTELFRTESIMSFTSGYSSFYKNSTPRVEGYTPNVTTLLTTFVRSNITPTQMSVKSATTTSSMAANTNHDLHTQILIASLFVVLSVVTIFGNLLVFVAFYKNKQLRTITNYFILSLAASDFLIGLLSINFYSSFLVANQWLLGPVICDAWLCVDYTCCQASVFNLVAICIDRYLSLTRPLTYRAKRTGKRAKTVIALIWIVSFLEWSPMIVGYQFIQGKRTVPEDNCYIQFLTENAYITFATALLAFYIPVTIMAVLYFKIYLLTKRRDESLPNIASVHSANRIQSPERDAPNSRNFNIDHDSNGSTIFVIQSFRQVTNCLKRGRSYTITETCKGQGNNGTAKDGINSRGANQTQSIVANGQQTARKELSGHKKAAKMLSIILLAYFITWLPYDVFAVIMPFCPLCIPDAWWAFGYAFCYFNSTINPFCYALGNRSFKETFKRLLFRRSKKEQSRSSTVLSNVSVASQLSSDQA